MRRSRSRQPLQNRGESIGLSLTVSTTHWRRGGTLAQLEGDVIRKCSPLNGVLREGSART